MVGALPATTLEMTTTAALTHNTWTSGSNFLQTRGAMAFKETPTVRGPSTMVSADFNMPQPSTGTTAPIRYFASNGIATVAPTVVVMVIRTDSGTSAPAMSVSKFEEDPPKHFKKSLGLAAVPINRIMAERMY
eukprot:CAMPEP_0117614540 /NCGR_PEP_ID=MMETSP0784-20121206/84091_1 /TAXON_ID=39447 /ORGANISM="" /LENGTH=132 /DNA_ID=CAMNT_0005418277 /DNA_START=445 /DNA_END=843 /DNA_ORIENTATION=-